MCNNIDKLKKFTIIIDCGHGGIDSNGVYTTSPNKMHTFSDGIEALEGVLNREIGLKVFNYLKEIGCNVHYTVNPSDPTDVSLTKRVKIANSFNKDTTVFISLHSNASYSHNASGFEIWTSIGETKSDVLATYIAEEVKDEFPNIRYRADYSDGDIDKESNFYVLKNTKCVAVLLENLFFDYREDFELLRSQSFQKRLTWRISNGIIRYLKTIR